MRKLKKDGKEIKIMDYSKVKISIASPEIIRSWSYRGSHQAGNHKLPYFQARA